MSKDIFGLWIIFNLVKDHPVITAFLLIAGWKIARYILILYIIAVGIDYTINFITRR